MPDLGKYAFDVTLAYAVSLALLLGFVALSLWQARRARRILQKIDGENG